MRQFQPLFAFLAALFLAATMYADPVNLRCEHRVNPLGIDAAIPHFSWQSNSPERNWRQSAYQIVVASDPGVLLSGNPDVWDSGKQASAESVSIEYRGPKLQSRHRYYWTVRVWDGQGQASAWAAPGWWEMGLLDPSDWTASWIGWDNPQNIFDRPSMRWISTTRQAAPATPGTTTVFRLRFSLAKKPATAVLFAAATGDFKEELNGHEITRKKAWKSFDAQMVLDRLLVGANVLQITITTVASAAYMPKTAVQPPRLVALLKLTSSDGRVIRFGSGARWQVQSSQEAKWRPAIAVARLDAAALGIDTGPLPQPAALLRRSFTIAKPVRSARLYATALGSYRMSLNGHPVTDAVLTPDFTDYSKRVTYQTYDISQLLVNGVNAVGAMLGNGWYASPLTWTGAHFWEPAQTQLRAQLEIEYADGTRDTIHTDPTWKAAPSAILHSEIYSGEVYDARLEPTGWDSATYDESHWQPASRRGATLASLSAQVDEPVRIVETLQPKAISRLSADTYVFDIGQNMVGWAQLRVRGPAGSVVRLRFAERLNPDGSIYTENLRNADATDYYILRGSGDEQFAPHFTFHGFRYVELTGFPGQPTLENITGQVVSGVSGQPTATLTTSSDLVNQMWRLGIWGQRGNFLSIPTDCPQRDERLGWMGDAGVFWRAGTYNFDIAAFTHKWMRDVTDEQTPQGAFTNTSPDLLRFGSTVVVGAPGWGDAGVIVPYTTWLQYGDRAVIDTNWDAMQRWMQFIQAANPDFLRRNGVGPNFGDWLAPDDRTPKDLIGTAYWAMLARMMSTLAQAAGRETDAAHYRDLFANIRNAFQKAYIQNDGKVAGDTQSSYAVTLQMNLASPSLEPAITSNLVRAIEARDWHLSTGFLGTPFLLSALADHGHTDVAYRLLLNDTYPSWGYMVAKGATTWWERWNGDTGDPAMNSYNHYAFGSVMAWVYRFVAGIDTTTEAPGFHEIVIHPLLDNGITSSRAEYQSPYGTIATDWNGTAAGPFSLRVTIPPNATATVYLPLIPNAHVTEDGNPVQVKEEGKNYVVQVGSGTYNFRVQ